MIKHRTLVKVILGIVIAILSAVAIYSAIKIITSFIIPEYTPQQGEEVSKTIVKDGIEYYPRQDISVFLLMGIDRTGEVKASSSYNNDGAADMVALAVFDDTAKSFSVLMLNRDTMVDMPVLGVAGDPAGTVNAQLALSHTYGTGMEDSCENVKKTVSDLLGGVEIDYYMSMNMDAVSILNDKVGGVTVTVTEDFSAVDKSIPVGKTTLTGEQALSFIRNRKDVGDQMNLSRMERQKEYMNGFMEVVSAKAEENAELALQLYNSINPYVVSDCPVNTFSTIINRCSDYSLTEIISPAGENVKGDEYMEYHVDEQQLRDLVIRLFYSEKPEF